MSDLQIIRPDQLAKMLGVSKMTLHRMEKRGDLPRRFKISKRAVGWTRESIDEWIVKRQKQEFDDTYVADAIDALIYIHANHRHDIGSTAKNKVVKALRKAGVFDE